MQVIGAVGAEAVDVSDSALEPEDADVHDLHAAVVAGAVAELASCLHRLAR